MTPRRSAAANAVRRPRPGASQPTPNRGLRPQVRSPRLRRGVQLVPSVRVSSIIVYLTGPPDHVSTLSGPSIRPYPASYAGRPAEGPTIMLPVSCRLSAAGIRFLVIRCPLGDWASLTVGLPALSPGPDPNGIVTLHTHETRPERAPSIPRGRRCPHGRKCSRPPPAASQRQSPYTPALLPSSGAP